MERWEDEIDVRSANFVGLTRRNLAETASSWPRTGSTPPAVSDLLRESRHMWVGAADCYPNFVASSLISLQAAELALRLRLGLPDGDRATFGRLFTDHDAFSALDLDLARLEWYKRFALYFRNMLSHQKRPIAFTPGFAVGILSSTHENVALLFPGPQPTWRSFVQ